MMQQKLTDFKTEYIVPSYSEPDKNHLVIKDNGEFWCGCKGFEFKGYCVHVLKVRLQEALEQRDYFAIIQGLKSHARFSTFEKVMDMYSFGRSAEFDFLSAVALGIALDGPVTADALHSATQSKFVSDPRIIGTVLGSLKRKGLLQIIGIKKSERRECHNRPISIFTLTEKGKEFLNQGGIC